GAGDNRSECRGGCSGGGREGEGRSPELTVGSARLTPPRVPTSSSRGRRRPWCFVSPRRGGLPSRRIFMSDRPEALALHFRRRFEYFEPVQAAPRTGVFGGKCSN